MRGANSQPMIASPKTRAEHPFGNRNNDKKIKKIVKGTKALYEIYREQCRVANAKERLKKLGAKTAWGRRADANDSDEEWSINAPISYNNDLREQLIVVPASDNILDRRAALKELKEKQTRW